LAYQWSLGNGDKRAGKEIEYTFLYPGQYVVVVSGEFKRQKQFARQTITVLPVELELTKTTDNTAYVLFNKSEQEIDIGDYRLVGNSTHSFPPHTIILPQSKVTIPMQVTSSSLAMTALYDQQGQSVAMHIPRFLQVAPKQSLATAQTQKNTIVSPAPKNPVVATTRKSDFGFVSGTVHRSAPESTEKPVLLAPAHVQAAAVATAPANPDTTTTANTDWPLYGLIALLFVGSVGIYLMPQKRDNPPWV
jgi:hypothetical protein